MNWDEIKPSLKCVLFAFLGSHFYLRKRTSDAVSRNYFSYKFWTNKLYRNFNYFSNGLLKIFKKKLRKEEKKKDLLDPNFDEESSLNEEKWRART